MPLFIFLKGGIELEQMLEKWYEFFDKERLNKWIDEDKENRSGFIAGVNEKTINEIGIFLKIILKSLLNFMTILVVKYYYQFLK